MAQPKVAVWGFALAGVLNLIAALIPLLRGRSMNVVFFAAGVVFLILAAALAKKRAEADASITPSNRS